MVYEYGSRGRQQVVRTRSCQSGDGFENSHTTWDITSCQSKARQFRFAAVTIRGTHLKPGSMREEGALGQELFFSGQWSDPRMLSYPSPGTEVCCLVLWALAATSSKI